MMFNEFVLALVLATGKLNQDQWAYHVSSLEDMKKVLNEGHAQSRRLKINIGIDTIKMPIHVSWSDDLLGEIEITPTSWKITVSGPAAPIRWNRCFGYVCPRKGKIISEFMDGIMIRSSEGWEHPDKERMAENAMTKIINSIF